MWLSGEIKVVKSKEKWRSGEELEKVVKNGEKRPFWMTENHFRSQFSPFHQYATFFFIFFSKWPPAAILDPDFFQKSIGTYLYSRSVTTSNMKLIGVFLIKFNMECTSFLIIFWFSDFLQNR